LIIVLFSRELFHKEHELLNQLNHPNIVQFYGYTIEQNYALIEHTDVADLYTYLFISQNISYVLNKLNHCIFCFFYYRNNIRLHILTQLSNALCYLESRHIIHRDIAARNCLIYLNYEIKLTNSAIASEQFQAHYYNVNQVRLPIRWMAPECISNVCKMNLKMIYSI
jgi:serine/threonine protein kinase